MDAVTHFLVDAASRVQHTDADMAYINKDIKPLKGHKRIVRIPKPKHAEEYSLEESARWQPWRVVLKVIPFAGADVVDYEVFLRADTPDNVMHTVFQLFCIWEHRDKQRYDNYPTLMNGNDHTAEKIDEQTYMEQWNLCQRLGHLNNRCKFAGDRRNPTIFRYEPMGWDHQTGIVGKPSIIIPTGSITDAVNSTKNRK